MNVIVILIVVAAGTLLGNLFWQYLKNEQKDGKD